MKKITLMTCLFWTTTSMNAQTNTFPEPSGKVGINTNAPLDGNLQVGGGTECNIFLGGGRGYSGISTNRSDGGLVLGWNIYSSYTGVGDNFVTRVGKTRSTGGFSGIKVGQNGQIDFFGKDGSATYNYIANSDANTVMRITSNRNVGIGTLTTGSHRLAVEGSIGAREIIVEAGTWSDFVFEKTYPLPTLSFVENFIKINGHLPSIPSTKEVTETGINLGEMDAKLLQKIEELTLYTIQQQKEIEELKALTKSLLERE